MRFATAETAYQHRGSAPAARAAALMGIPILTDELQPGLELEVRCNQGRWIVDCPWCRSAQVASFTDRRFLCGDCGNVRVGGRWARTIWPKDPESIEALLEHRPAEARNWRRGETAAQLRAENRDHGIED